MIKIAHLYPDLLNLYGDYANVLLLEKRLAAAGKDVCIVRIEPGMEQDLADADLIYMGSGTEKKMLAALGYLRESKEMLVNAVSRGCMILASGNAAGILCRDIEDKKYGTGTYEGLGMLDGKLEIVNGRRYGEVICDCRFTEGKIIGAVNSSVNYIYGAGADNFCTVEKDSSGRLTGKGEGFIKDSIFTTEMAGPVLFRNPELLEKTAARLADGELPACGEDWYAEMLLGYRRVLGILEEEIK